MPAEARSRIKSIKAERLGLRSGDDFPDVDAHAHAKKLEFIHQRDIDAAIDVLQELGHLRGARRADQVGVLKDALVERLRRQGAGGVDAADNLGNLVGLEILVSGIFALG